MANREGYDPKGRGGNDVRNIRNLPEKMKLNHAGVSAKQAAYMMVKAQGVKSGVGALDLIRAGAYGMLDRGSDQDYANVVQLGRSEQAGFDVAAFEKDPANAEFVGKVAAAIQWARTNGGDANKDGVDD